MIKSYVVSISTDDENMDDGLLDAMSRAHIEDITHPFKVIGKKVGVEIVELDVHEEDDDSHEENYGGVRCDLNERYGRNDDDVYSGAAIDAILDEMDDLRDELSELRGMVGLLFDRTSGLGGDTTSSKTPEAGFGHPAKDCDEKNHCGRNPHNAHNEHKGHHAHKENKVDSGCDVTDIAALLLSELLGGGHNHPRCGTAKKS